MSEPIKLGRPRRDSTSVKSALMHICSTRHEKERYEELAAELGMSLSALVRELLDARLALRRHELWVEWTVSTGLTVASASNGNGPSDDKPEHIHSGRPLYDDSKERPK